MRHLAALEATARLGSFRAAAIALGYSQSALSGQIAALEAIVGTPLLDRPRGAPVVSPTPAGLVVLERAERIGDILAATRADLAALAADHEVLRVGIFQSASVRLLPPLVRALRAARPELEIRLHEAIDPAELSDLVLRGDLDVVFASGPPRATASTRPPDRRSLRAARGRRPPARHAATVDPATVSRCR